MGDGRIRLVVLFGGQSAEHDVSCVTARHVLAAADPERYDVVPVGITRTGRWVLADAAEAVGGGAPALTPEGPAYDLLPAMRDRGDRTVVFPLLHGPLGEDGTVQGMLELADVPYVGAGVLGSAVSMDKATAKALCAQAGIAQAAYRALASDEISAARAAEIAEQLGLPCFVKPANMGSSIGVSKAGSVDEVEAALRLAATYDRWIVVEEAVVGREIECSVLGNRDLRVSVPGEIRPGAEFYTYEDKYHDGRAELIIPADLAPDAVAEMQRLAVAAYRALRVEGMARADFFYEDPGRGWLLNELNTIPGFTPISMYPKLWEASGLSYPDLIDTLVELAVDRHARRPRRTDH